MSSGGFSKIRGLVEVSVVFHTVPGLRNEALFRIGGECGEFESGSKPNRNISEILMKSGWSISDFSGWFRGTFFQS